MPRPIQKNCKKILIRGQNSMLGDLLMTTPLIAAMRHLYPKAEIHLMLPEKSSYVFEHNPHINKLVFFDAFSTHKPLLKRLSFALKLREEKYDIAILIQRAFEAALLTWLARIPVRLGYDSDSRSLLLTHVTKENKWNLKTSDIHQADYHLNSLRPFFHLTNKTFPTEIYPQKDEQQLNQTLEKLDVKLKKFFLISPGTSNGYAKLWERSRWEKLFTWLTEHYPELDIVVIGGPNDVDRWQSLTGEKVINLVGKTSLTELIQITAKAMFVISTDNGTAHLATALKKPEIVLFGSSNPKTTAPYLNAKGVIYHKQECAPCCHSVCHLGHHNCMKAITVEEVQNKVMELLPT